ncbi:hypothetical protein PR048_021298, partial [Dryococelus australis]
MTNNKTVGATNGVTKYVIHCIWQDLVKAVLGEQQKKVKLCCFLCTSRLVQAERERKMQDEAYCLLLSELSRRTSN